MPVSKVPSKEHLTKEILERGGAVLSDKINEEEEAEFIRLRIPKYLLKQIDERREKYMFRTQWILRAIDEYLQKSNKS